MILLTETSIQYHWKPFPLRHLLSIRSDLSEATESELFFLNWAAVLSPSFSSHLCGTHHGAHTCFCKAPAKRGYFASCTFQWLTKGGFKHTLIRPSEQVSQDNKKLLKCFAQYFRPNGKFRSLDELLGAQAGVLCGAQSIHRDSSQQQQHHCNKHK